ncbi:peptidoglycan-recognition protein LC-like [Musca vetustissima]|uniref:peptidoglycan-recognition protein LC-like n=1 Tax=Musca vetustissima TaxID=27455 RepID=UPI002AB704BB|nr:peptidoglycan-recognition protein LC-like [Musca vetustissima]
MHFNQLKQEEQQQELQQQGNPQITDVDFTKDSDRKSISLLSDGCHREIKTLLLTTDNDKFGGSSSSSTDSGVNVSDNEATTPPSPLPQSQQLSQQMSASATDPIAASTTEINFSPYGKQRQRNDINNSPISTSSDNQTNTKHSRSWNIAGRDVGGESRSNNTFANELKSEEQLRGNSSSDNNCSASPSSHRNAIKSENVINSNPPASTNVDVVSPESLTSGASERGKVKSPYVPQRAPSPSTSSVVSSSESEISKNPPFHTHHYHHNGSPVVSVRSIDSSVIYSSDSDSDENANVEGEHKNYVIKKLGTQVTYPPKHPDIPVINNGLKVVDQKITPNGMGPPPASPLDIIKNMSDNVAVFHPHRQVAASSSLRPQVAISSSTDVTIGDKHFYEGPVTIQQFLIDSRNKWNESNGNDNVVFVDENGQPRTNDINEPPIPANSDGACVKLLKQKKYMIASACAVITLIILAIVFGIEVSAENKSKIVPGNSEESRKNIPINSTIALDNVGGGNVLRIVPRDGWLAQPPINPWVSLSLPVERVIIIHTRTTNCETQAACTFTVRNTQTFNIESQQQDDIIYNFLIGGDGNVYEGRGWDNRGSVIKGYNDDSISLAYIGSFKKQRPSDKQLNVTRLLLAEGVRLDKLTPNYRIVGANKLDPTSTATSADALYESFEDWPHWSDH